jgi:uncharacterized protein (DUF1800 family)
VNPGRTLNKSFYRPWSVALTTLMLAACGSGDSGDTSGAAAGGSAVIPVSVVPVPDLPTSHATAVDTPTDQTDAVRLANQASMGATEALVATVQQEGVAKWLVGQFEATPSVYTAGRDGTIDTFVTNQRDYSPCQNYADVHDRIACSWETSYVAPVQWDFVKQALVNPDQLRQRVALALSQLLVVGEIGRTYATRNYQQLLRGQAFGNYRDLLREVTLSPVMGSWLNLADSSAGSPNENYARELMELFTIGKCNLNLDGSLVDGKCTAPYDNSAVTANAAALSGWTYPLGGGQTPMWCYTNWCADGRNPPYYNGPMVPIQSRHNTTAQALLSGVQLAADSTPVQAVEKVLDSVMAHPNMAPFISRSLIQFLVTSNPSAAYIKRVATVFNAGTFRGAGSGRKGDMKAVIAAILLDAEARDPAIAARSDYGRLREPPLAAVAALRVMGSTSDGIRIDGSLTRWSLFDAETVFNFFPSVFSVPGAPELNGPEFKAQTVQANYDRTNFMSWLVMTQRVGCYVGCDAFGGPTATPVDWTQYEPDAGDNPQRLIDRLDMVLTARTLSADDKASILDGMQQWTAADQANTWLWAWDNSDSNWRRERAKMALYLVLSSPSFQIQR